MRHELGQALEVAPLPVHLVGGLVDGDRRAGGEAGVGLAPAALLQGRDEVGGADTGQRGEGDRDAAAVVARGPGRGQEESDVEDVAGHAAPHPAAGLRGGQDAGALDDLPHAEHALGRLHDRAAALHADHPREPARADHLCGPQREAEHPERRGEARPALPDPSST
ncbi:hypothetical protein [Actinomycetospora cinnamomea]|uniref:hypothetical protein n=1 Tax=Actinomycetospora cinnamomea TaxID=663609 RepID=UPI001FAFE45A|nr:hypothetical protein [Actinomycetospora cinnamomea]